jgi:hypothetical protein
MLIRAGEALQATMHTAARATFAVFVASMTLTVSNYAT